MQVPTTIHNIIVGKLWCDQHGTMDIVNHTTMDVCTLKYTAYSFFASSEARKVTGAVKDRGQRVHLTIEGLLEIWYRLLSREDPYIHIYIDK